MDHLDHQTVKGLQSKVTQVICPFAVGQDFEYWDYNCSMIHDLDWYENMDLGKGWQITATPARHFSGRGLR